MRLSLAFVSVALAAIALLAALTAVFAAADVDQLAQAQRLRLTQAMAVVAAASRDQAGGWSPSGLMSTMDLAGKINADVQVTDLGGQVVDTSPGFATSSGPLMRAPVRAGGHRVGTLTARFDPGLGVNDRRLREEFFRAIAGAAGLAALVALIVAIGMSRRITRPVARLIEAASAVGGGDRTARVGSIRGPTELAELAETFDRMADELARQEQLHRILVADVAHELRTPVAVLQAGPRGAARRGRAADPGAAQLAAR